jgi:hypothetical protein
MSTLTETRNEKTALFGDLSKPSLHALSYVLRHPHTWPKNFYWDYNECENCAMGLAHLLWHSIPTATPKDGASIMAREFAVPFAVSRSIFLGGTWTPTEVKMTGVLWWKSEKHSMDFDRVTPEMVADQIDAYLAKPD